MIQKVISVKTVLTSHQLTMDLPLPPPKLHYVRYDLDSRYHGAALATNLIIASTEFKPTPKEM